MIRDWLFRKQYVQSEGLYIAIRQIIHYKQTNQQKQSKTKMIVAKQSKTGSP